MSALLNVIKARIAVPSEERPIATVGDSLPARRQTSPVAAPPRAPQSARVASGNDSARRLMAMGTQVRDTASITGPDLAPSWSVGLFDELSAPAPMKHHPVASPKGEAV